MDLANIATITGTVIALLSLYLKMHTIAKKEAEKKEVQLKEYVDKEINHLKESSITEIKNLENKIDSLRDDLREHQKQIISLIRDKK